MTGQTLKKFGNRLALALAALLMVSPVTGIPASAQIQPIDPNDAIDADLGTPPKVETPPATDIPTDPPIEGDTTIAPGMESTAAPTTVPSAGDPSTYQQDDLIGAAEGVFGKGAQGLGNLIEDILKKQGQPNGYIVGREGGGALVVGLRYGSGTLHHKVEGQKPVYWTGPSIGFDAGANAGSTFVLVYNLYDTEDLYRRFPSGEGVAYLVGGFNASYLRRGDIVLIPIRVGAGLRLGANVGYMKFSKKQRWLPF
ncbi:MAG: DUF1134 domain-containing protein [Sphingomonadales bacterium]|jgi:hypothetical protein|nr:DUF1134 domain-containing protein [Sphingomonadales bacterium]MBK9267726.1 DUF1134 domain-containing protein [Sphingomonadales bacterium]MBP6433957.1 DUF1134 domain-containing protein [Sphingorhabdus sp.]